MINNRKIKFNKKLSFFQKLFNFDWLILFVVFLLCIIGVGSLYSASDGNLYPWSLNHFYRCCFGFIIIFMLGMINPNIFFKYSYLIYFLCILGLIYVQFYGVGTVRRWIDFKLFFIQPSELTKLALILFLAKYFNDFPSKLNNFIYYVIPFFAVMIPTLIVINQPDLGTGFMIFVLGISLIFIIGLPWKVVFSVLFVSLASIPLLWEQLYEYQKHRIIVFLNPKIDTLGSGYQIMQSKIAIGSGGIFGKGYLLGSQSRLDYLPEKHTDFVFTLISEEMGFVGSSLVLFLFVILIYLLLKDVFKETNLLNKIVMFGIAFLIFLYVTLNVGMVSGIIPVVGAPLPFISHGGTSLLTVFLAIGIIQSIRINKKEK